MTGKPKQLLTAFGLAGGLVLASAPAHATFILDTSCGVSKCAEGTDFFIDNANTDVSTFTGTVGGHLSGPAVTVFTAGNVDTGSDFATITPATGILTVLIFTPADDTLFNGFSFRGQLAAAGFLGTVDVSWLDSNDTTGSVMFTDADFDRLGIVSNDGETLRRVAVSVPPSEAAGERFKEFEQIEFSSVTPVIPEPSTWVMMLLGFAGLGFVGYRAARKGSAVAAEGDAVGPEIASAGPRLRELRQPGQSYSDVNHALLDRGYRLAGHSSESLNFSLQGERIGRALAMLPGVPVALGSSATSPVHTADRISPIPTCPAPAC